MEKKENDQHEQQQVMLDRSRKSLSFKEIHLKSFLLGIALLTYYGLLLLVCDSETWSEPVFLINNQTCQGSFAQYSLFLYKQRNSFVGGLNFAGMQFFGSFKFSLIQYVKIIIKINHKSNFPSQISLIQRQCSIKRRPT